MSSIDLGIGAPADPELDEDAAELAASVTPEGAAGPGVAGVELVDERQVRIALSGLGGALHHLIGDPDVERHWRFTADELDALTPPMTAIVNRRPALRRAVARGDELALAVELAGYVNRNVKDGQTVKEARERDDEHGEGDRGAGPAAARTGADAGVFGGDRWGRGGGDGGGADRSAAR